MDPEIRGLVGELIDGFRTEEDLTSAFNFFRDCKPAVKSEPDAVFGYFIGNALGYFVFSYKLKFDRSPSTTEIEIFRNFVLDKVSNLMSDIRDFANR